jgi:hypothetical protein
MTDVPNIPTRYSPGVCPDKWAPVSMSIDSTSGVTAARCPSFVPSELNPSELANSRRGYSYNDFCSKHFQEILLFYNFEYAATPLWTLSPSTPVPMTTRDAWLDAVNIQWTYSDLANLPSAAVAQLTSAYPVSQTSSPTTSLPRTTSPLASSSTGSTSLPESSAGASTPGTFQAGAEAGIGVGVTLLVLLFLRVVVFYIQRKKLASKANEKHENHGTTKLEGGNHKNAELEGDHKHAQELGEARAEVLERDVEVGGNGLNPSQNQQTVPRLHKELDGRELKNNPELGGDQQHPQELMSVTTILL